MKKKEHQKIVKEIFSELKNHGYYTIFIKELQKKYEKKT